MNTITPEFIKILVCPETKSPLKLADAGLVEKINAFINQGQVFNRRKEKVIEAIEGGLIPEKNPKLLYPIRSGIPVMLIDEAISLEGIR